MGKHENVQKFEQEEDMLLLSLVAEHGTKWKEIIKSFPGMMSAR